MHAKLSQFITRSSLWREPEYVRCVFIAFLANKDENGYVEADYDWIRKEANLTDDEDGKKFELAIKTLESPDIRSKNKDFDGKRIVPIDGGWIVTGHEKYRLKEEEIREQTRLRVARYRDKLRNCSKNDNNSECNVTGETVTLPTVSVSVSDYDCLSSFKDKEKTSTKLERYVIPPTLEMVERYCRDRKNGIDPQGFIDHYETRDWKPKGYTKRMTDWQATIRTWERNGKRKDDPVKIRYNESLERLQQMRREQGFIQ